MSVNKITITKPRASRLGLKHRNKRARLPSRLSALVRLGIIMGLPEKIDNASGRRTNGDTEQKRVMHRLDRRLAKNALRKGDEPVSVNHKYQGWTT